MGFSIQRGLMAAVLLAMSTSTALAGGFAIREQSAESQGLSFAGAAAGTNGLSAMYWNPATISRHNGQGFVSESNAALILPYSQSGDGGALPGVPAVPLEDSGNIGVTAFVPSSYWVYGVNDKLTLGGSFNAPFGLSTDSDTWVGSPHGNKSSVATYNLNVNAAYEITDGVTFAAGVQGELMQVKLTSDSFLDSPIFAGEADDIALGFTLGLLFEPMDGTSIGLGFRSSMKHGLKGEGNYIGLGIGTDYDINADFATPEIVTLGISQAVTDQLTLKAGVEWTNWSRFKSLDVAFEGTPVVLSTTENWNDGWYFSLGGEYAYSDNLTLRAGVAYETSPVPDGTRTPRMPDNDRVWLSAGASYKFTESATASVSYSHVFMKDGEVALAGAPPLPPLYANFDQHLDIISASLTMDW